VANEFKSVIAQTIRVEKILPIERGKTGVTEASGERPADFIYEPDPETILARLLPRYLEFIIFRVLLESSAAEHAARMTAMDSASRTAGDLIDSLTLTYNRARQARITKELIEIVSGSASQ
jgi:F-type H+-transporting ATPase subunit gamma